jgi:hypothetical protein
MVTSRSLAKRIVPAEDNSAGVMLLRMTLNSSGLDCESLVLGDGNGCVTNPGAPRDRSREKKRGAMQYFRNFHKLAEHVRPSIIVSEVPSPDSSSGDLPEERSAGK